MGSFDADKQERLDTLVMLRSRVSKHALYGTLIAVTSVIVGTLLVAYVNAGFVGVNSIASAQWGNAALWVLDCMPFVYATWGQYASIRMTREANQLIRNNSRDLLLKFNREQLQSVLLEFAPDAIVVVDTNGIITQVNAQVERWFAYSREELVGEPVEILIPQPWRERHVQHRAGYMAAPHARPMGIGRELSGVRKDGSQFPVEISLSPVQSMQGLMIVAIIRDISAIKQIEQKGLGLQKQIQVQEQRFHDLVSGLDALVWEAEVSGEEPRFLYVSPYAEKILGYPVECWYAESGFWRAHIHPDDREATLSSYRAILKEQSDSMGPSPSREVEYRMLTADGRTVWFRDQPRRVMGGMGVCLRGVVVDLSERKALEAHLTYQASHDALTELPNRTLLLDRLSQMLSRASHHARSVAVLFLDLDRFKDINDTLGHHMGDQLLRVVAERLCALVRPGDTVARLGGDEFVVLLDDMAREQDAADCAQKILDSFNPPFRLTLPEIGTREFYIGTSIGISLYPGDGKEAALLLKAADTALYRAKEGGGNTFQFFTQEMDTRAHRRLELGTALHAALERKQFVLHYQPQVELATGSVTGVEALLRWNHPQQGLVSPAEFVPVLEETGLILPVGEWVLREACAQSRVWYAAGLPALQIAVNLSARQLMQERFADTVAAVLADTGMDPQTLELEITESMLMQRAEKSIQTLHQIRALGVRLSLDDFGTGYSSLSYLRRFPLTTVKIDRSFICYLPDDRNGVSIVQAVLAIGRNLRLGVVAEGVETREQLAFLRAQGCPAMQGYLFSRPLPADALTQMLKQKTRLPLN